LNRLHNMIQPSLNIEFEERWNQITIKKKHFLNINSDENTWNQFYCNIDEALRTICRDRSRSRALDVVHVMIAIILILAQIVVYIVKGTTSYQIFCSDGVYQQFICNWFRSDLSWIPIFLISYGIWVIVLKVCIRRCIFKRSRRVFIERINELCTQLSSTCPTWKIYLCPPGFSCFSSLKKCSIKIEQVTQSADEHVILSADTEINTLQELPVSLEVLPAFAIPCDQKGEQDVIYCAAVQV
jgi:hypothetical protein